MLAIPFLLFTLFWGSAVYSQRSNSGSFVQHNDPYFDTLLFQFETAQQMRAQNPDNMGIEGYRVQIFFDSGIYSGDRARVVKEEFEENHENVKAYITWRAPNYRVRVGDFRTRLDAEKFLNKLSKEYPNAWVIKDEINFPDLN